MKVGIVLIEAGVEDKGGYVTNLIEPYVFNSTRSLQEVHIRHANGRRLAGRNPFVEMGGNVVNRQSEWSQGILAQNWQLVNLLDHFSFSTWALDKSTIEDGFYSPVSQFDVSSALVYTNTRLLVTSERWYFFCPDYFSSNGLILQRDRAESVIRSDPNAYVALFSYEPLRNNNNWHHLAL